MNAAAALARFVVGASFIVAALVWVGYRLGPEHFWPLALLQYLPYPVLLVPAALAVLCSWVLGRGWRIAALAALAMIGWAAMGLAINLPAANDGLPRVRLMTWNIKSQLALERPDGFAALAREIERHAPDIVVVQDGQEPGAHRGIGTPVAALFGDRQRYALGQFVIASRFPLRDCASGAATSGAAGEAWVRCTVAIRGVDVDLYNAHLRTPRLGLDATRRELLHGEDGGVEDLERNVAERLQQARALAAAVRAGTRPAIVAGDLNAPEPSLVVRALLDAGLRDAHSLAGLGFGHTYGHAFRWGFSFLRIDHVLVGRGIAVASCGVGGAHASAHRPVIADLLVPVAAPLGSSRAPVTIGA